MMRSLYSGVSGMQNHQTRLDVIGNNVSNVNTTGFKRGRVNFQDMISQQLSGAAKPTVRTPSVFTGAPAKAYPFSKLPLNALYKAVTIQ